MKVSGVDMLRLLYCGRKIGRDETKDARHFTFISTDKSFRLKTRLLTIAFIAQTLDFWRGARREKVARKPG